MITTRMGAGIRQCTPRGGSAVALLAVAVGSCVVSAGRADDSPAVFRRPEPAVMETGAEPGAAEGETSQWVSASEIAAALEDQLVAGVARPRIDLTIEFAFGSASLTPSGRRGLDEAGEAIGRHFAEHRFALSGHTDSAGSADYNLRLSSERAEAARAYLIERYGIAPKRLEARGFGESEPLPGQRDARNRRVSLELLR